MKTDHSEQPAGGLRIRQLSDHAERSTQHRRGLELVMTAAGLIAVMGLAVSPAAALGLDTTPATLNAPRAAAEATLDLWVQQANGGAAGSLVTDAPAILWTEGESALPAGTQLDRVDVRNQVVAAHLTMPARFLAALTEEQCEALIREQVALLKGIADISGFALYARPAGADGSDYRPLPAYLPRVAGPEKSEDFDAAGDAPRSGGLPTYNPGQPAGALSGKTVFLSPGHGWYYSSTLSRWATQRGNNYGIIEDHSNGEAVLQHLARYLHNAGANVWPCRERDFNPNMVIVDNSAGAPAFTTTDTWPTSTSTGTWYGTNYQQHAVSLTETAVATFAPDIPAAGYYAVYLWTPSGSNRATDAKVRVRHTGGITNHVLNMQRDGNTWRFLGLYHFAAGRDPVAGAVEISNQGADVSKYVIADAVRFGGGMGDYVDGGSTSGKPRWEESGNYFPVFMGQPGTPYGTVSSMPRYADWESESWEDSIYISWHTNASTGAGHGTDVYVYGPNGPPSPFGEFSGIAGSNTLAVDIRDEIINDLRLAWNDPAWPGRLYTAWFGELNPSNNDEMPSVLIEVAYHDSAVDAESILDPRFRDMFSRAVYQAVVRWWYEDADGPSSTPITTDTLLPEPPTHLLVRNTGGGTARVSWRPPPYDSTGNNLLGDAATGYVVQRSLDGFGFDDGTATTDTWLDVAGLTVGQTYYFRVVASNAGGQSFPSEIGALTVAADPPVLLVNGFDRMDKAALLAEDDPYDTDAMLRERPERMNSYAYARTYAAALQAAGLAFDYAANEAVRDQDVNLADYAAVLWQLGEEADVDDTFDSTEQARVWTYVNAGGNLLVSGAETAWDLDAQNNGRSFYNNILKADYVGDDAGTYSVTAVAGSIFAGLADFTFDNGSSVYDVDRPDQITIYGGSSAALSYSGGLGTAGVVYTGTYKLVNLGFPFEAVTSATVRNELLYRVLDFFGLDPTPPPPPPPADIILECRDAAGNLTPAPAYVEVGAWANSTIKSTAAGLTGTGSRFIVYELPNTGTDNATFTPSVVVPGKYAVYATWANGANCYDARYTIRHYQGAAELLIDQIGSGAPEQANYNQWIPLGSYWFTAGQATASGSVNVSEETVSGKPSPSWNQRVYTDGLKLAFVQKWPDGDRNADGHTDLVDFTYMPDCVLGPGNGYATPQCEVFDFDLDVDVDLDDFAAFQGVYSGQ